MGIKGACIALLEARMSSEMADLVRRYGGAPYSVPAVREVPVESGQEVSRFIDHLAHSSIHTVIFLTGAGVTALLREAEQLGRLSELLTSLRSVVVVCRGPKPAAVLKRNNIPIALNAKEPYTTEELLAVIKPLLLAGTGVAVVHYGERNAFLTRELRDKGAHLEELCLYEWRLPEDISPLQNLVKSIIASRVDAVVFTSQIQARHLFLIAEQLTSTDAMTRALNTQTIVASIGPTCTPVLQNLGVMPHVIPEHPKMGYLVKALAVYMG